MATKITIKPNYEAAYHNNGFKVCKDNLGEGFVRWFNTEYACNPGKEVSAYEYLGRILEKL